MRMLTETMGAVRSVASHRQLVKEFVGREIRGRFAGAMMGSMWAIVSPVATILSYVFVFSLVLRVGVTVEETGTDRFVLFFLAGFFPWILFADALVKSATALLEQAGLITKVIFPVEVLPVSKLISVFILNGIGFLIFLFYLACSGYFHITWCLLPLVIVLELLFAMGLAFFFAALTVFIRDTTEVLSIVTMVWFFATPIIYPASLIPDTLRGVMGLNPMALYVGCVRDLLLIHRVDGGLLMLLSLLSFLSLLPGTWFFMRSKPAFGDVL